MEEVLTVMTDDAFARLVAEEVKNRVTPAQREYFHLPENWDRWQRALVALVHNLDQQLTDLHEREARERARYEALGQDGLRLLAEMLADVESRTAKISRFRYHVEQRLEAVQRMMNSQSDVVEERAQVVEFLRRAVSRHQTLITEADLDPTPIDEALWAALDGRWEFDSIDLSALD